MRVKNIGGGGAEYHVAVRPQQGGGCGKGDVLPPTQSTRKFCIIHKMETILYKKLRPIIMLLVSENSALKLAMLDGHS